MRSTTVAIAPMERSQRCRHIRMYKLISHYFVKYLINQYEIKWLFIRIHSVFYSEQAFWDFLNAHRTFSVALKNTLVNIICEFFYFLNSGFYVDCTLVSNEVFLRTPFSGNTEVRRRISMISGGNAEVTRRTSMISDGNVEVTGWI